MPSSLDNVRHLLNAEEPNYKQLGSTLGTAALPHLSQLVVGENPLLAAKATHLAGVIGTKRGLEVIKRAATSSSASLRVAAASGAQHLPTSLAEEVLVPLIDDVDLGVRKAALRSSKQHQSESIRSRVKAQSVNPNCEITRALSSEVLQSQVLDSTSPPAKERVSKKEGLPHKSATTKKPRAKASKGPKRGGR